eukprot:3275371-Rhodomonas_salina.2
MAKQRGQRSLSLSLFFSLAVVIKIVCRCPPPVVIEMQRRPRLLAAVLECSSFVLSQLKFAS